MHQAFNNIKRLMEWRTKVEQEETKVKMTNDRENPGITFNGKERKEENASGDDKLLIPLQSISSAAASAETRQVKNKARKYIAALPPADQKDVLESIEKA